MVINIDYSFSFKINVHAEEGDEQWTEEYFQAKVNEFASNLEQLRGIWRAIVTTELNRAFPNTEIDVKSSQP